jgi:D-3-phosphoglycerate dehydrogenase
MGNIGRAVARMLSGFDVQVLYNKRGGPLPDEKAEHGRFAVLPELLERSDIVTLHCPGGGGNRHMIDAAALARMKKGAVLINVARGDLVEEAALVEALRSGHLSAAGLDVFAQEPLPSGSALRKMDNVVLTPHSAGSIREDVALMASHALRNVAAFFEGRPLDPADVIVDPMVEPWRSKRQSQAS